MNCKNPVGITQKESYDFWLFIQSSFEIEQMYEETKNVLVTLSDKFGTTQFIYYKGKSGRTIRILHDDIGYHASLWLQSKSIGGIAEGERGKRKFKQTLKMFQKAIYFETVNISVEKNPHPPALHIPLTEKEEHIIALLEQGLLPQDIQTILSLTRNQYYQLIGSLKRKGKVHTVEGAVEPVYENVL